MRSVAEDETSLTPRELEVLRLVAADLSNRAVAERLGITENTTKRHLQSIFGKLDVGTRKQAVAAALSKGSCRP